nr:MAG TPA: tail protein [Caudoviricetes sp.]
MLINIHDSHLEKVGFLDSESPGAPGFFNDVEHHYLAEGASTFTFSVNKKKNGILQDYCQFLNEDAYFSFSENGEDHFYSVGTVDEDNDTTFTVTCYSLNLELRLEQCDPLENTASHNIQWYFDQMGLINNTQITIGINEVSDLSRVIKYDGQESKLARLISLIGNFDAEFEFITKSNNDGTLDKIILNIYKENDGVNFQGVGTNRDDVILTLDTNINGVSRTVDKTQIFNATTITGADGLTWNSSEFSYVNSDGVEEFYKRKNADTAFAPLSLAKYPSQIQSSTGDRWIRKNFTTDYTTASAIWGYAVSQFKKFAYGIVTYKVSVSSLLVNSEVGNGLPLKIGDTVTISDDNFIDSNGVHGLILSARVSEMEISRTDPTKNTLIFSNYIRLQSQISNDLQSQLSNLVDAATPYRAELTTTNGTQFKNGTGSTTLSAHIFKGSATTETTADSYEWSKDGTIVAPTQTITVDASGVTDKAVYSFKATVAGKVVASQSVTITNVNDGTAGAPGTPGSDGRSITNIEQKYRLTTSSSIPTQDWTDSGWLTSQPTTTSTNKYLWSITRTTFTKAPLTQDIVEQKAVYGNTGKDGNPGKIVSDTEPTTRFKGLTWKYSGTADLTASDGTVIHSNTEYYYNGTHWMINYLSANNLEANSITADLIDAKNLTITDGEFVSTIIDGSVQIQTEIKDDYLMIYKMDTSHNEIHTIALKSDSGLVMTYQNSDTGEYTSAGVNFQGLFMQNNITNEFARLTPQGTKLSTDIHWTTLSPTNGFSGGSIQFSVQNGVEFFSIAGLSVPQMNANQWYQATSLPAGSIAIPSINRVYPISGNNNAWDLLINPAGGVFIRCQAAVSATSNLVNGGCGFPIG